MFLRAALFLFCLQISAHRTAETHRHLHRGGTMSKKLALFDVDGTLTEARAEASPEMKAFLQALKAKIMVGIVGGSDLVKQQEQMGAHITDEVDYRCA
jgi:hypothetical protein